MSTLVQQTLSNGLTVLIEPAHHVESVAYELQLPGGTITDPAGFEGSSLILSELLSRGAGELDSEKLLEAFDERGISHGESGGFDRLHLRGGCLDRDIARALELTAKMVREPRLPAEEIEPVRSLFLQDIAALADNPAKRAGQELSARYYPAPFNRSSLGTEAGLKACNEASIRADALKRLAPTGAILSIAGRVEPEAVFKQIQALFGDWKGGGVELPRFAPLPPRTRTHIAVEAAQMQLVLAVPGARFADPLFYAAKVMNGILSGGMFGRLFIEVREKRGLCYTVHARHAAGREFGMTMVYAGTTPERAHETLSVILAELERAADGITAEEMARAKANLKASVIMSEESMSGRAATNASDQWLGGRIRSVGEISAAIDGVTVEDLHRYLAAFPWNDYRLVTLGSRAVEGACYDA